VRERSAISPAAYLSLRNRSYSFVSDTARSHLRAHKSLTSTSGGIVSIRSSLVARVREARSDLPLTCRRAIPPAILLSRLEVACSQREAG
jgi:hypothetical protein